MAVTWQNTDPRLRQFYVDLQKAYGARLPVTSAYRDPAYNAKVGGAKHSQHMKGDAIDIDVSNLPEEDRKRLIKTASSIGAGGVGIYDNSLHFDLAGKRAWGPSYHSDSVPDWAAPVIQQHLAQADTGSKTDAGPSRDEIAAELKRRGVDLSGMSGEQTSGPSKEEIAAELKRRGIDVQKAIEGGLREGVAADQPPPPGPGFLETANQVAQSMVTDINAGFQGVNPVGVSQQEATGPVIRLPDGVYTYFNGEYMKIPPENYKLFVTQVDPATGQEMLYERTPAIEESPLASAGRVLSYATGVPAGGIKMALPRAVSKNQAAMQAFKESGKTPSLGMTGPAGARAAAFLEGAMPSGGIMERDVARSVNELQQGAESAAASVGEGAGPVQGGMALQEGANRFLIDEIKGRPGTPSRSDILFARVDRAIPSGTMVNVGNASETLQKFVNKFANMPEIGKSLGVGKWQKWASDIAANGGNMTWEQARALRSDLGQAIGKMSGPLADTPGGEIKQLYGALTEDLDNAAKAAGKGPYNAWKNATNHYKWATGQMQDALDILFKAKNPEKAYSDFLALGAAQGSRANIAKLAKIKRALPEEEWSTVVATVVRRMGEATPGTQGAAGEAFSSAKFLTDWNKLSSGAKQLLFEGKGVPRALKAELDSLATMMETAKNAQKQINTSRSGSILTNAMIAAPSAVGAHAVTLANIVGMNLGARALTSPRFLRVVRNYIAKGGSREAATKLIEAAGNNPALLSNAARIIRLGKPTEPSGLAPMPQEAIAQ